MNQQTPTDDRPARRVLISGASIAGPATAWWLTEYGFDVTVVERTATLRPGGYRVDVRGAGVEVAKRMGLRDEVLKKATHMTGSSIITADGKTKMELSAGVYGIHASDDSELMRDDMSQILYDATKDRVEYVFGDSIATMTETPTGVDVTFDHGQPRSFDFVIGADGIYSHTRKLLFHERADENLDHLGFYISVFSIPNFLDLHDYEYVYYTAGKLVNAFNAFDTDNKVMMLFRSPQQPWGFTDVAAQKQLVRDAFRGEGSTIEQFLTYIEGSEDFYFSPIDQVKLDRYSQGRVALVGDAGYCPSPASGQGSSVALVGAYVLAGELAICGGDYAAAFASYEQQMRPYVAKNQEIAPKSLNETIPSTKFKAWYQNVAIKAMILFMGKDRVMKKMFSNDETAVIANSIHLKDYQRPAMAE